MAQRIHFVLPGSPAERAGLRSGDIIKRIGGELVIDLIDFQALTAVRRVEIDYLRGGATMHTSLRKGEYESTGLEFEKPLMSGMRMCCNHCLFCFVDQLPCNVRQSMRVKDDDWRMSLMTGSYVTLTNVSDVELDRIIARHVSPLYISVHCTDPELRSRILGQMRGAKLMQQLKRLSDGGVEFHTQAVLCPELNDGQVLEDTIRDLITLPGARSLALVPVGLTGHREGLAPLEPYSREQARAVIALAESWRKRLLKERGTRFVFPSDEFYLRAELPLPEDEEYEGYEQIDDGVGLLRLTQTEFVDAWNELGEEDKRSTDGASVIIACGVSAAPFLRDMLQSHPITGVQVRVIAIENRFFGSSVTVSGLVTGGDLTAQLKHEPSDRVLITQCMLRSEGDRFLDDMTLTEAEARLGRSIVPVGRRGEDLLEALLAARTELGG